MKILVVDDELIIGGMLGRALSKLGHEVTVVADPREALGRVEEREQFDAMITDIDMPWMDGVQLARAVRAQLPTMPIAFCTGSSPDQARLRGAGDFGQIYGKVRSVGEARDIIGDFHSPCEDTTSDSSNR